MQQIEVNIRRESARSEMVIIRASCWFVTPSGYGDRFIAERRVPLPSGGERDTVSVLVWALSELLCELVPDDE